jgi:hypothetical protein
MSVVDKVIAEWAFRCKKGYPDMNNPDDIKILKEIYTEYGIVMEEEKPEEPKQDTVTVEDLTVLRSAFESIKVPYSKYLSIFNYFDPNSLGTISEVLLTKLLNTVDNIQAQHVGGAQGLADIVVNGHHISLKTTAKGKPIGLGSDEINVSPSDSKEVVSTLNTLYREDPTLKNLTISELQGKIPNETYNNIHKRLSSIARKIAGELNKEVFVWVEKVYKKKLLTGIVIHVVKYDYSKTLDTFLQSKISVTEKAWGVVDAAGKAIISADTSGKHLNITPEFVYSSSKETNIPIDLEVNLKYSSEEVQQKVSDKVFTALNTIYSELF